MDWAAIFNAIIKFLPRIEILHQDEGGLFLRAGKYQRTLPPGAHFCLPYFDQILRYTTAISTLEKTTQSITTRDRKEVFISWTVTYLVADPVKAFYSTDDIDAQIEASIADRITEWVGKVDYAEANWAGMGGHVLRKNFVDDFRETWGINVKGFYVSDLALHRIFRLVGAPEKNL